MSLLPWTVLVAGLALFCYVLAVALFPQPDRYQPKHRADRRHRPGGDRLTDHSHDADDVEEWLRAMRDPKTPAEREKSRIGAARILRAVREET